MLVQMVKLDLEEMDECYFTVLEHACLAISRSYNNQVTCFLKVALFLMFCKGVIDQLQEFIIKMLKLYLGMLM